MALQLIKGIMKIVRYRSFLLVIVLAASIAGIAQANPDNMGTNDLQFNTIFDNGLSISIAPRAK